MTTSTPSPSASVRASDGHSQIRVASVPENHVYVRHLARLGGTDAGSEITRLPDPRPATDHVAEGQWWPPRMLDPEWVRAHHDEFDVFHVHFGFDAVAPDDLRGLVDTLRELGKPLVQTVHDLRNPHHARRADHDAQLDVLVPAADELITLTPGAAEEIDRRWRRAASVLPHPHVVDLDTLARVHADPPQHDSFRVGLHAKSLRAAIDPVALLPALMEAVEQVPDGVLQVDAHHDVVDSDGARHDPRLVEALRAVGDRIDLRVHDFFTDDELWEYLASLDVSVLPYRFGTHSGWLEACRDLGTAVVAPSCGYYAQQGGVRTFVLDEERYEPRTLVDAVLDVAHHGRPAPITIGTRTEQRNRVAAAHAGIYARALGR